MADIAHNRTSRGLRPGTFTAELSRTSHAPPSSGADRSRARPVAVAKGLAADRVTSVDALRGFAMLWIITGDAFAWALHDLAAGATGPLSAALQFVSDHF